jgi:FkbM family methyltransferase
LIVNTSRLFNVLLSTLRVNLICDVGSMNGADALKFRKSSPHSIIFAFEPNPENFRQMESNPVLRDRDIRLVNSAAANADGNADFFLVDADYSRRDYRRGMSSLLERAEDRAALTPVRVKSTRLDSFLADKCGPDARLALWIDSEGMAYEVIEGMSGIAHLVRLLHVEVETRPCIGAAQRLHSDVKTLLNGYGFVECATDQPQTADQFNALYVRSVQSGPERIWAKAALLNAWLRQRLIRVLARVCPACLRRYQHLQPRAYDL